MKTSVRWVMRARRQVETENFSFDAAELLPRQIAARARYTIVSPGTEGANYLALDPDVLRPNSWCSYPWVPGYAGVGEVIAVGPGVTEFQPGQLIVGHLKHASEQVLNLDEKTVVPLHPDLSPKHAGYTRLIGIALTACRVVPNEVLPTVGVWGQGVIGNFAAQLFQRSGAKVVGIDPIAQRRELSLRCGIRNVLDPAAADYDASLGALTRNEGFDVVVDTIGHAPTTVKLPAYAQRRGHIVLLTHWRSQESLDTVPLIDGIFWKGLTVYGAHECLPDTEFGGNQRWLAVQRRNWLRIQEEIVAGQLKVEPLVSQVVTPAQCHEVYEGLCFDRANWWGVVVDWT